MSLQFCPGDRLTSPEKVGSICIAKGGGGPHGTVQAHTANAVRFLFTLRYHLFARPLSRSRSVSTTPEVLPMLPMIALRQKLGTLLADDIPTLAPATANKIALVNAAFSLDEGLIATSLSYANFTGSTPISGAAGDQGVGNDPLTGDQLITNLAPVGGWRFVCTVAPGAPETIFGFALLDHTLATLLGAELLPTPIAIVNAGDEIDLGAVTIRFVQQPMS